MTVPMKNGEALIEAFAAILDTTTADAVDEALLRLGRAATDLDLGLDLRPLAAVAHRAAGRHQSRRRRELSLLALNQALAELGRHDDADRLRAAIVDTIPRLAPGTAAVWLSEHAARNALRVPLTESTVLHVGRSDGEPLGPDEVAAVQRYAQAAASRLSGLDACREAGLRQDELTGRLGTLDRTGSMMDTLLGLTTAPEPPLPAAVAEALSAGLDTVAALLDPGGRLIAAYPAGPVAAAPELARRAAADPGRVAVEPGASFRYAVAVATVARSEGTILVVRRAPLTGDELAALRRAAHVLAALRVRQNALLQAYEEMRTDLLTELLVARRPLSRPVRVLAEARRFPLDRQCLVVAIDGEAALGRVVADAAALLGGVGGRHDGTPVAVLPGDDPQAVVEALSARMRRVTGEAPRMCASDPTGPAAGTLPEAFEAARHGLALLRAAGSAHRCATTRDLALYRPLFDPERSGDVRDLLDGALRPLLDYEREHHIDLVETVHVFLATGGNASQAARRLFIHPNTMTKRLDRVSRLLGDGWQDGVDGLRLRLALHLRSLGAEQLYDQAG
ncbi:helix-turn-helix domain-containing protein [Paractinoplanes maris]|uniref:helix-turn-helix domain-containing protein n=1 Tax=Paractinoplanes maris TaxID=1734446 RepID=UPI0020214980|nr:helix-turn-helix domain-containing protein [Actinoplanes maris]